MSLINDLMDKFGFISRKQFNERVAEAVKLELDKNAARWLGGTADAQKWTLPDPVIYANQADLYRLSPVLGTAIDILGSDIGAAKFNVARMVGEDLRDIPNHELEQKMRVPNLLDTGMEFIQFTVSNYLLNGNATWWMNRESENDRPSELWPIPFSMLEPVPDGRLYLKGWNYYPGMGKKPIKFSTWEILHFRKYNPANRFVGLSPIESLATTIKGDLSMRNTNTRNYVEYGGAPPSILSFKEFVPNEQWKDIKDETRAAAKRNEMMMLRGAGDGVTWLNRQLSNRDMEYINVLRQNIEDIFNRMCPGLLAMLAVNTTQANALAARATYAEKTVWPMMETISQKITASILPAYGRKLIGSFEDPRVVDRQMKLKEQEAYERTHTVEETRYEYYKNRPLGDERDKMLVVEANSTKPGPTPMPALPRERGNPANAQEAVATQEQGSKADALDELLKWRRMAMRGKAKAIKFKSYAIPADLTEKIRENLTKTANPDKIRDIFENAIKCLQPATKQDANAVLEGLRLAVGALKEQRDAA